MDNRLNFWQNLPSPAYMLAPMEDVTDTVFRSIVMSVALPGKLHVLFTEFVSSDGLCHPKGFEKVKHRLKVGEKERLWLDKLGIKLVAQIWGNRPEKLAQATKIIGSNYQFDGIDINMGCPVKKIVKQGSCSALIGQPKLATEIVLAVKDATNLPVSVKTRTGIKKHDTENWLGQLMLTNPAALILHCRCQADMSEKPADWNQMALAVKLRNQLGFTFPLIGNGDIFDFEQAERFIGETEANGVMIGRGIFHNPWMFGRLGYSPTPLNRIELMQQHASAFKAIWQSEKNYAILKRFFKIYSRDFPSAAHLKAELMETNSVDEMQLILSKYGFDIAENETVLKQ